MYARTALFALVAAAASVAAQTSSAPAAIPSGLLPDCATGCIDTAIAASGCTLTDAKCVCTNEAFLIPATACLAKCPTTDQTAAQTLQKTQCAGVDGAAAAQSTALASVSAMATMSGMSMSGSSMAGMSMSKTGGQVSSASGTAPASSTSSTGKNGVVAPLAGVWQVAVAALGVVAGGAFIL